MRFLCIVFVVYTNLFACACAPNIASIFTELRKDIIANNIQPISAALDKYIAENGKSAKDIDEETVYYERMLKEAVALSLKLTKLSAEYDKAVAQKNSQVNVLSKELEAISRRLEEVVVKTTQKLDKER